MCQASRTYGEGQRKAAPRSLAGAAQCSRYVDCPRRPIGSIRVVPTLFPTLFIVEGIGIQMPFRSREAPGIAERARVRRREPDDSVAGVVARNDTHLCL